LEKKSRKKEGGEMYKENRRVKKKDRKEERSGKEKGDKNG
jgi:rRNA processing protein Gar1